MSASQHKGGNQHNGGNQHKGGNLTGYVCYAAVWVCTDLCGYVQTYQQKEVISLGRNGTPLCGMYRTTNTKEVISRGRYGTPLCGYVQTCVCTHLPTQSRSSHGVGMACHCVGMHTPANTMEVISRAKYRTPWLHLMISVSISDEQDIDTECLCRWTIVD